MAVVSALLLLAAPAALLAEALPEPSPAAPAVQNVTALLRGAVAAGSQQGCARSWAHNCKESRSCCEEGFTCYEKTPNWAACLRTCTPNAEQPNDSGVWTCRQLSRNWFGRPVTHEPAPADPPSSPPAGQPSTCSASWAQNCKDSKRCCEEGFTCYEKTPNWAACLRTCKPNAEQPNDKGLWTCRELSSPSGPADPTSPPPVPTGTPAPSAPEHQPCKDMESQCAGWAKLGECTKNPVYMSARCKASCGQCGRPAPTPAPTTPAPTTPTPTTPSPTTPAPTVPSGPCTDDSEHCAAWSALGECGKNPGYMNVMCKKSCGKC